MYLGTNNNIFWILKSSLWKEEKIHEQRSEAVRRRTLKDLGRIIVGIWNTSRINIFLAFCRVSYKHPSNIFMGPQGIIAFPWNKQIRDQTDPLSMHMPSKGQFKSVIWDDPVTQLNVEDQGCSSQQNSKCSLHKEIVVV